MFTGIVEEIGEIKSIKRGVHSESLTIKGAKVLEGSAVGDSIAVNGICLTATSISGDTFTADVMAETMRKTSLGSLSVGSHVNLERAMLAGGRFGGHIVSGHIDGVGTITNLKREENAVWVTIETTPKILRYIIEKGSIAIDGISLTVAYVDSKCFKVSIIPHTASETTLLSKKPGDLVNLENDVIGKYVEKLLGGASAEAAEEEKTTIDTSFLAKHGFI